MGLCGNEANTSKKGNVQVFNSIVRSKLLHSSVHTGTNIRDTQGFIVSQTIWFTRSAGTPSIFIDREETNQRMYEEIQRDHHCKFEHFGDMAKKSGFMATSFVPACRNR